MAKVTAPVTGYTGNVVGVTFTDGVGETDSPVALAYFRRHGYAIEAAAPKARTAKAASKSE